MKNILFASNLSKKMGTVFKNAAVTAISQKANIIIVHVMEDTSRSEKRMRTAFGEQIYQDLKADHIQGARNVLIGKKVDAMRIREAMTGFFQSDDTAETHSLINKILVTESQSIANEIVATAVEERCEMIVMGCKQQGLLAETMGDNVVRKVLKRSAVPVLVIPLTK